MTKLDISAHFLVPKHTLLLEEGVNKLLNTYSVKLEDLPRIKADDAGISHLDAVPGNVVRIERASSVGGMVEYYRLVE